MFGCLSRRLCVSADTEIPGTPPAPSNAFAHTSHPPPSLQFRRLAVRIVQHIGMCKEKGGCKLNYEL